MKSFFRSMFSSGNDVSSKRFSAFFTLFNIIILAYVATFMSDDKVTPEFMFDALALIAGGGLGLTVVEKIFTSKGKGSNDQNKNTSPEFPAPSQPTVEASQSSPTAGTCACGSDPATCPNCKPLE